MTTTHNHPPSFGRKFADCPRCMELAAGAAPVQRPNWYKPAGQTAAAERLAAIRAHDCKASRCGPVCTAFDW